MKTKGEGKLYIEEVLQSRNISYVKEHQFMGKRRRFRFDYAILDKKIAIEFEGLESVDVKGKKIPSGHTTKVGYTSNCTKYNLAAINGWKVLRFTALNYKDVGKYLSILFPR